MHSQVALLLQDAFLQAENFSVPGIGSFIQRTHPDQIGVEIVFDEDASRAPSLASYWQKEWGISGTEAAQRLSELRVALRWGLKTNGHFLIPEVGALHQHQGGKLQFHSLAKPEPVPTAIPLEEEEAETPIVQLNEEENRFFSNRMIGYMLIGAFGLIGLLMIGQAMWGTREGVSPQEEKQVSQASLQESAREEQAPQMSKTASYHAEAEAARLDSPLRAEKSHIVSTSRPQDREITPGKAESSPASMITPREQEPLTAATTMRSGQTGDGSFVDIAVLDTNGRAVVSTSNARMASRGQDNGSTSTANKPASLAQYHLIAGSFANYQAARDFVEEMRQQGSPGIILPASEQTHMQYRVSIFHHENREEVARYKQNLLDAGKKAGWIFAPASQETSF